ncbi:MAG: GAK system ATP-grasp enzyme [Planctomycetes bacterium]|nr:GAK system ATP-grasp enzyme [Planctomycetota bacterium]
MTERRPALAVAGLPGRWSTERLADAVEERTGRRLVVDLAEASLDLASGVCDFRGTDLAELDAIVVKKIDEVYSPANLDRLELLRFLEARGVRIFSRPDRIGRLINRLSGTVELRAAGIPVPDTVVTEDPRHAVETVLGYGAAVLKPLYSTKARGMRMIESDDEAEVRREVEEFCAEGHRMMYIQRRVPMPDRDLGVVFIGERYWTTYARVSGGESWNTTTREGGTYAAHEASPEIVALARRARDVFELDFTVVDVVESDAGTFVFEVSAFGGFRGIEEGCGLDAAGAYVDHVLQELGR